MEKSQILLVSNQTEMKIILLELKTIQTITFLLQKGDTGNTLLGDQQKLLKLNI
jgi:hypothetical protein